MSEVPMTLVRSKHHNGDPVWINAAEFDPLVHEPVSEEDLAAAGGVPKTEREKFDEKMAARKAADDARAGHRPNNNIGWYDQADTDGV